MSCGECDGWKDMPSHAKLVSMVCRLRTLAHDRPNQTVACNMNTMESKCTPPIVDGAIDGKFVQTQGKFTSKDQTRTANTACTNRTYIDERVLPMAMCASVSHWRERARIWFRLHSNYQTSSISPECLVERQVAASIYTHTIHLTALAERHSMHFCIHYLFISAFILHTRFGTMPPVVCSSLAFSMHAETWTKGAQSASWEKCCSERNGTVQRKRF